MATDYNTMPKVDLGVYVSPHRDVRVTLARMFETPDGEGEIKLQLALSPEMYYTVNHRMGHLATQDPGFLRALFETLCPELVRAQAVVAYGAGGGHGTPGVTTGHSSSHAKVQNLPRPPAKPCYNCGNAPAYCLCPKGLVPER